MKRIRLFLLIGILLNVVLALYVVDKAEGATLFTPAHDPGVQERITVRGGVLRVGPYNSANADCVAVTTPFRLSNTCVYIHDNSTHAAVGIKSITWAANGCDVVINTDAVDSVDEIVSATAEED